MASERTFWYSTMVIVTGPLDSVLDDEQPATDPAATTPANSVAITRLARTEPSFGRPMPSSAQSGTSTTHMSPTGNKPKEQRQVLANRDRTPAQDKVKKERRPRPPTVVRPRPTRRPTSSPRCAGTAAIWPKAHPDRSATSHGRWPARETPWPSRPQPRA